MGSLEACHDKKEPYGHHVIFSPQQTRQQKEEAEDVFRQSRARLGLAFDNLMHRNGKAKLSFRPILGTTDCMLVAFESGGKFSGSSMFCCQLATGLYQRVASYFFSGL
jgi:hypothetical protein